MLGLLQPVPHNCTRQLSNNPDNINDRTIDVHFLERIVQREWTRLRQRVTRIRNWLIQYQPIRFAVVAIVAFVAQPLAFLLPHVPWLPTGEDANSFLRTMWQVHAAILGVSVIVVAVITTIISGQEGRGRIWVIYKDKTNILLVLWFNLVLLASEGLAILESYRVEAPLIIAKSLEIVTLVNFLVFLLTLLWTFLLFVETLRFLNPNYIEDLTEARINAAIPDAVRRDLRRSQDFIRALEREQPNGP